MAGHKDSSLSISELKMKKIGYAKLLESDKRKISKRSTHQFKGEQA
jgi:hypothetical protein